MTADIEALLSECDSLKSERNAATAEARQAWAELELIREAKEALEEQLAASREIKPGGNKDDQTGGAEVELLRQVWMVRVCSVDDVGFDFRKLFSAQD